MKLLNLVILTFSLGLATLSAFAESAKPMTCDVPRGIPFVRLILENSDTAIVAAFSSHFDITNVDQDTVDSALTEIEKLNESCTTWKTTNPQTGLVTHSIPNKFLPYQRIHRRGATCDALKSYKAIYPGMFKNLSTFRAVVEAYEIARLQKQDKISKNESLNSIRIDYPILQTHVDETIHMISIDGCATTLFPAGSQFAP